MCRAQSVLLVALFVGLAQPWDIAVSVGDRLEFYTNGTKTDTVHLKSHNPTAIAYDEDHKMMLFVDKQSNNEAICGYNLASKDIKCFIKRYNSNIQDLAFDPVTDMLFFTDTKEGSINWILLKDLGSEENVYKVNILIKMDDRSISNIAVDSCKGNIYWTNIYRDPWQYMERAQFNGGIIKSREVVYTYLPVFSFAIDQQTQTNYYIDGFNSRFLKKVDLRKKNLNAENAELLNTFEHLELKELTVSNNYLYWMVSSVNHTAICQASKNAKFVAPREICKFYSERPLGIAANYRIRDQLQGLQDCEALSSLIPITVNNKSNNIEQAKQKQQTTETEQTTEAEQPAKSEQITETEQTTEKCEVHACHGYCLNNGACSLNEKNEPVCQCETKKKECEGEYVGDRCESSSCLNYCFQGSCSFNVEGYPECRCNAGFFGERCEVAACHGYCLNNGECTLNEEDEPACQCFGVYEGSRCEALKDDTATNTPQCYYAKRNISLTDLLSKMIIIDV